MSDLPHVLTLVAAPGTSLSENDIAAAGASLTDAPIGAAQWLAPDTALDLPFAGLAPPEAMVRVRTALGGRPVDIFAQPAEGRRKRLLLADMDSTIITVECLDELADFAGLKEEIAAITERTMRGELAFEPALRERVARLKGLEERALERAFEERVRLTPGARTLVRTMAAHGAHTALVSGGFTYFTARVAKAAGFHEHFANVLEIEAGRLTGEVREPILGRAAKLDTLMRLMAAHGLTAGATLAVGDGANDLAMIEAAGAGVAFHAKPVVAEAAGFAVNHGDLTALLYLQGYRQADFDED